MTFSRYAIYYTLPPGPLAEFGAAWLGWDAAHGCPTTHPKVKGLPAPVHDLTARPRKYGFHGTMKPPFRLAHGQTEASLLRAVADHCARCEPVVLEGLACSRLGRFLALTPLGNTAPLGDLAAATVTGLDRFRAPATDGELARRRKARLTPAQDALLVRWGYPFVMEAFRFHITLTGPLPDAVAAQVRTALAPHLEPLLPAPFVIDALTLAGEDADGRFHEVARLPFPG